MAYSGRTEFRATRGAIGLQIVMALVVLGIAVASLLTDSETWVQIVCWFVFLVGILAVMDTLSFYTTLGDTELQMRRNFRTVVVIRDDIDSVAVAKGCPMLLVLRNGSKIEIPSHGVPGLDNSLRSWVRAARQ